MSQMAEEVGDFMEAFRPHILDMGEVDIIPGS